MEDPKQQVQEAESLRRLAFYGIAISTIATLTAIICVPMLYNYMQHVQSSLQNEVDFCRHRTDGLWDEYSRYENMKGFAGRIKREANHRHPEEDQLLEEQHLTLEDMMQESQEVINNKAEVAALAVLAELDPLDHPDHPDLMETLETMDSLEMTDNPDRMPLLMPNRTVETSASTVLLDHLDLLETLDHPDLLETPEDLDNLDHLEDLDSPDSLDHPDMPEVMDSPVALDNLELLDKSLRFPANLDSLDNPDRTDLPGLLDNPEHLETANLAHLDLLEITEETELLEILEALDNPETRDKKEMEEDAITVHHPGPHLDIKKLSNLSVNTVNVASKNSINISLSHNNSLYEE